MANTSPNSPEQVVKINGKTYALRFNMLMMACAENCYYRQFGEKINVQRLFEELFSNYTPAVMACAYGALSAGGVKMPFEHFAERLYTLDTVEDWTDAIANGISAMMPDPEPGAEDEPTRE